MRVISAMLQPLKMEDPPLQTHDPSPSLLPKSLPVEVGIMDLLQVVNGLDWKYIYIWVCRGCSQNFHGIIDRCPKNYVCCLFPSIHLSEKN
jgi:hypothetical protein